jgi:hypothetical protein
LESVTDFFFFIPPDNHVQAHDKLTGVSINNVAQYMKKILDLVKQVADSGGPAADKRLLKAIEEMMAAANKTTATAADDGRLAEILVRLETEKASGTEMAASLKRLEASSVKERVLNKLAFKH